MNDFVAPKGTVYRMVFQNYAFNILILDRQWLIMAFGLKLT